MTRIRTKNILFSVVILLLLCTVDCTENQKQNGTYIEHASHSKTTVNWPIDEGKTLNTFYKERYTFGFKPGICHNDPLAILKIGIKTKAMKDGLCKLN